MKNTAKLLIVAGMTASLFVGCSCSSKPEEAGNTSTDDQSTPNTANNGDNQAITCDDERLKASLIESINTHLQQGALSQAQSNTESNGVTLDNQVLASKMQGVNVDVSNFQSLSAGGNDTTSVTSCQASVSMTIDTDDVVKAGQIYVADNRPSLQEQMQAENIQLNDNVLVDDNFMYVINTDSNGAPQAKIVGEPSVLQAVAGVVVSSVLKDTIGNNQIPKAKSSRSSSSQGSNVQSQSRQQASKNQSRTQSKPKNSSASNTDKPKSKNTQQKVTTQSKSSNSTKTTRPKGSSANQTVQWYESDQPSTAGTFVDDGQNVTTQSTTNTVSSTKTQTNKTTVATNQPVPSAPVTKPTVSDGKPESLDPLVKQYAESQKAKQAAASKLTQKPAQPTKPVVEAKPKPQVVEASKPKPAASTSTTKSDAGADVVITHESTEY